MFASKPGAPDRLNPRWIFLRALGLIFLSALYPLLFEVRGLVGPSGILPAQQYLEAVARAFPSIRYWFVPTLLWLSSGNRTLLVLCSIGVLASLLLTFNIWPRGMLTACLVCFLSLVSAAQNFSEHQSDGMLLEAGFIYIFMATSGFRPGWDATSQSSRASYFLLQWEWLRIYFEPGLVKLVSGEPQWQNFTAMDEYYQNGPL